MNLTIFEKLTKFTVSSANSNHIHIIGANFIDLEPVMDMCRKNNMTLIIDFPKEENE